MEQIKLEKSCGAVVYKIEDNTIFFLIEKMKRGHYSIPKGHVEDNETEIETALREIKEETNLDVEIDDNFREVVSYSPYEGCMKDVVFFVSEVVTTDVREQKEEVSKILWLTKDEANLVLTYESDKNIINKAYDYIKTEKEKDGFVFIKKGSKVLFQGDSVTDNHRDRSDENSLGGSHAKMVYDAIKKFDIKVVNKGISGNKVNDLLNRFENDFKNVKPDYMFLLIGVNDTWHGYPDSKKTDVFKEEYELLINRINNEMNCELILMEPFILGYDENYTVMRKDLYEKIFVIRDLAYKYKLKYISFENEFAEKFIFNDVYEYTIEGIHPLKKGYELMTKKILSKIIIE